jgi:hypothetical protein
VYHGKSSNRYRCTWCTQLYLGTSTDINPGGFGSVLKHPARVLHYKEGGGVTTYRGDKIDYREYLYTGTM